MANTVHRIDASGNITIQGELDEIALQGSTTTKHRIDYQGNLYVIEFDEVSDPGTFLESVGDTNLQFTVSNSDMSTTATLIEHIFYDTGIITSSVSPAGEGTWYNGTPTGANFEIQIVVNSMSVSDIVFEDDIFFVPGTSSWYSFSTGRTIVVNFDGNANITVKVREISNPSNEITKTFTYEIIP